MISTYTPYLSYSIPLDTESLVPYIPVDVIPDTLTVIYSGDRSSAYTTPEISSAEYKLFAKFPTYDPTEYCHGLLYHVPDIAAEQAGSFTFQLESSEALTFVQAHGVTRHLKRGSYATLTNADGVSVPAILYSDGYTTRVFFEKGTMSSGGELVIQIASGNTFNLRMKFLHTIGSYITLFKD